jgi:hypothetical protein
VTRHRSDRFGIEACVKAWHRRFSEWEMADSYLPAIAMVATSVTVRNFTNSYKPQIATLCVLESRWTGLLGVGTSALLGRHTLPRRAPSRAVLRRTERGGGLDAMDGTLHWVRGHDPAILQYLRLPLMR